MKKLGIVTSVIVITSVFIYSMVVISAQNTCSGVRTFDCQKQEDKNYVDTDKYFELKPTGDLFLKTCVPEITEEENTYLLDYSSCDLKVNILKTEPWVNSVEANGKDLTREEINSNFR